MNCRGGFHKRRFDETSSRIADNIYGLRDNIKGQMARHKDLTHGEKYNTEAILRELYGSLNAEQFKTDPDPRRSYRNTNDARNSISVSSKRSTSLKDDLNEEQFDTYDFINNEKRSDDDYPFDLDYVPTALADPPPLDRLKNIKATHDKYSDYDLLDVFDDFSDRDSLELLRNYHDSGKMRILDYIKRLRR
ncbi:uncharacterized protein LOC128229650 isoform X2 [Mya arenaria]|uniref:uncharacterized protein LOC128229650 isoform X2 n=1 Tax=Mya arenaria TaxID=6604 RepID=UPI0022DEE02C|nr:uncharacterized protein LOC128229650 isoform X2 [Mya arenaria]